MRCPKIKPGNRRCDSVTNGEACLLEVNPFKQDHYTVHAFLVKQDKWRIMACSITSDKQPLERIYRRFKQCLNSDFFHTLYSNVHWTALVAAQIVDARVYTLPSAAERFATLFIDKMTADNDVKKKVEAFLHTLIGNEEVEVPGIKCVDPKVWQKIEEDWLCHKAGFIFEQTL